MESELDILKSKSLTTVVQAEIERLVRSGSFKGGDRINENALAARFNVSRGPIREACRALTEKGLFDLIPNRGVFLRQVTTEEAADLYDVRAGIFSVSVRKAAQFVDDALLGELGRLLDAMDASTSQAQFEAYYDLNLEFHYLLVEASRNQRLMLEYRKLIGELHLFRANGLLNGGGLEVSNSEHRAIVEALRRRDAKASGERAYRHVQNGKARMLAADGAPHD